MLGYLTAGILLVFLVSIIFILPKVSYKLKRRLTDGFFASISGLSAIFIIIFIIYFFIHIYILGKSHLSWEFIFSNPLDGLTRGGIFPAIIGTSLLVLIMSIIGVPIGTITAIYLAEYAKENSIITKSIRFAVNTLSGIPAIVFGLFGLGFFIGVIGKQMDNYDIKKTMNKMEILFNQQDSPFRKDGKATVPLIRDYLLKCDKVYWHTQLEQVKVLSEMNGDIEPIEKQKVMQFFRDRINLKWGQPALIWAALTMALLTLPIVIVSVEEAIRTIPREIKEASLALGATKFATILKIVIPGALPGILTGTILTISRGAGEVAPILFTGVAYYLPDLPNSFSSQFMHLGYHIYVLTTQSTNVELTKPLQYATTLVLLLMTFMLNFTAIFIRSRIRSRMSEHG
ncbi:MAG: Phosphate transporter permease [Ignavibacteria bacterium]|nr:Phosphate transporter permease [Ignavibacteria bacterium]